LPEPQKIVIYRLVQEALNNVSKHSGADHVQIHLIKNSNGIKLCVQDNGRGFNKETILSDENEKEGLGLQGMKERAELSNGTFEIWSEKGKGTGILVRWPIY
jgi:signal transduction histidine kinase